MGIALPQLAPASEDRVSGAQVFDGSLRFDKGKKLHLIRTPGSSGNQKTWTLSFWFKKQNMGDQRILFNSFTDNSNRVIVRFMSDKLQFALQSSGTFYGLQTNRVFRDNGWYHVVLVLDTTQNNETSRQRIYVNGDKIADGDLANNSISGSNKYPTKDASFNTNTNNVAHYIGANNESSSVQDTTFDGQISNAYLIDGLAIAPAFFGYTDPLTNTWRPRGKLKKTVNDGTNFTADITNTGSTLSNPGRIFDGTTDSDATIASGAATITYTPSTPINYTDSVRVMGSGSPSNPYNARWQLNGGTAVSAVNANEFVTLDEGNGGGTITTIKLTVDSGGANWRAIQVDGVIMKASSVTSIEFGTNGFYLPFDGKKSIGEDQSGKGNNWTPVNFGGSTDITKATGARPILNTANGGTSARPGVFGSDAGAYYYTTSGSNSGGKYVFEDQGTQPTFSFIRGATYVFDWSASTDHPLRFATAADAAGSTGYTDGVDVTGNVTTITVPHNAPDTLYYYCNVHNGMGNSISVTTDETKADPYAWKCVVAMPLLGFNGDVSDQINVTSSTKVVTTQNNAAPIYTRGNFYGGSFDFDGNGDRLVLSDYGSDLSFAGDFTMECWLYIDDAASLSNPNGDRCIAGVWSGTNGDWLMTYSGTGDHNTFLFQIYTGGSTVFFSSGVVMNPYVNRWVHLAVVRNSNSIQCFVDGIAKGSATSNSASFGQTSNVAVGGRTSGDAHTVTGSIQDLRIYNGVAKYTSNFVPASTSPDILPDTPSGVSGGSKLTKITDGAVNFGNASGYLSLANTTDVNFGSGAFTWECFAYFTSVSGSVTVMGQWENSPNRRSWLIQVNDGKLQSYVSSTGQSGSDSKNADSPANYLAENRWYHIAVTRSGNNMRLFIDGELITTTDLGSFTVYANTNDRWQIGAQNTSGSHKMKGSLSDVRILKGTALYTSSFTPPTRTLTNVTNTKLLCCQSNSEGPQKTAVIPSATGTATAMWPLNSDINDDSGNSNNLSETGGSTSFTSAGTNPFGLSNCADFAADGKYLSYTVDPASAWTIDGYVKFDDVSSGSNSYVLGWNGTDGADTCMGLTKADKTFTVWGSSNLSTTTVAESGKWYHIRMTTNSTTDLALYVNGVLAGRSSSSDGGPSTAITIGDMQSGRFDGQIAGVRYTPTDLGAPPLGGETTSSGVTSNSPTVGVGLAGDVAATNFNPFNTDIKTVRGQEGVYATFNPIDPRSFTNGPTYTLSDGALTCDMVGGTNHASGSRGFAASTIDLSSGGKWYCEYFMNSLGNDDIALGIASDTVLGYYIAGGNPKPGAYLVRSSGIVYAPTFQLSSDSARAFTTGDLVGVSVDLESTDRRITFYKNGVAIYNTAVEEKEGPFKFVIGCDPGGSTAYKTTVNFGQKPFKFSPPDGFQPLTSTALRPESVIARSDQYVGVTTYAGIDGTQSITNFNMKPDLVWVKNMDDGVSHFIFDSVRGNNNYLRSDTTNIQDSGSSNQLSIIPRGFSVSGTGGGVNDDGKEYVCWSWKAGGNSNTFNVDDVGYSSASSVGMNIGGQNDNAYNKSQTWSNNVTGGSSAYGVVANAFNGNLSNYASPAYASAMSYINPSASDTVIDTFEIYGRQYSTSITLELNDTDIKSQLSTTVKWHTITGFSGQTFNKLYWRPTSGNLEVRIYAIRINGKILVDTSVTPPNAPTIASTGCSVGTKQGFSVVRYTGNSTAGATVAHGLSQTPDLVIVKQISGTDESWRVRHAYSGDLTKTLYLNQTVGNTSNTEYISDAAAATITLSSNANGINSSSNYIVYSWHNVPGLQKFGKYVGNASSNGPFVETGMRPALVVLKKTTEDGDPWIVYDAARNSSNLATSRLQWNNNSNQSVSEDYAIDILSNGFKIRTSDVSWNDEDETFVYMAWAEAPAYNLFGAQSNAR